jgi:hypothetical protein
MQEKLIYKRGNLHTGAVYAVEVVKNFGSSEIHGPFSSENEAWNYGMDQAQRRLDFVEARLVTIETPTVKSIATLAEAQAKLSRFIVTDTDAPHLRHGVWDRQRGRFIASFPIRREAEARCEAENAA